MLPEVAWTELIPADVQVDVRERETDVDGNVSPLELEIISKLVKLHQPRTIFEIGTFNGRTTLNLAAQSRPEAHVYTLDLPRAGIDSAGLPLVAHDRKYIDKPASGLYFQGSDVASKITQLYGDSATFDYGPFLNQVDFVFVDGSHSYHYVLNDSRVALNLLRGTGIILWHDYVTSGPVHWPGLVQALDELQSGNAAFAGIQHIAGTALAYLQVAIPWPLRWARSLLPRRWRLDASHGVKDSRKPAELRANLDVTLRQTHVRGTAPFEAKITVKNTGRAIWLPHSAPAGSVLIGCHLCDRTGKPLDLNYSRHLLTPHAPEPTLPGESRQLETTVPAPPPGQYVLEFDLVSEGVCWFARNGSPTVRVPVEVL